MQKEKDEDKEARRRLEKRKKEIERIYLKKKEMKKHIKLNTMLIIMKENYSYISFLQKKDEKDVSVKEI